MTYHLWLSFSLLILAVSLALYFWKSVDPHIAPPKRLTPGDHAAKRASFKAFYMGCMARNPRKRGVRP